MNAPVLIVRTVSVEKLSPLLDVCRARWPGCPLWVVTSAGRESELRTDVRIAEVVGYPMGPDGFTAPIACAVELAAVVVPVANQHGRGYANVLRAADGLRSRGWWIAARGVELRELGRGRWTWRWRTEMALERIARVLGRGWAGWALRRLPR